MEKTIKELDSAIACAQAMSEMDGAYPPPPVRWLDSYERRTGKKHPVDKRPTPKEKRNDTAE